MAPIQVVIDTNVIVSAFRSKTGASHKLLRMFGDQRFEVNVSTTLLYEYEEQIKRLIISGGAVTFEAAERFLGYIVSVANQRNIIISFRPHLRDPDDDFLVDLAVASGAEFIITFNLKDFEGLSKYGIYAVKPGAFLRLLERIL